MHWVGEDTEFSAKGLDDALQPQTYAKDRQSAPHTLSDQLRHAQLFWRTRPRGDQNHAGIYHGAAVEIDWIQAEDVEGLLGENRLRDLDGIVIPGGFGERGVEGGQRRGCVQGAAGAAR